MATKGKQQSGYERNVFGWEKRGDIQAVFLSKFWWLTEQYPHLECFSCIEGGALRPFSLGGKSAVFGAKATCTYVYS